MRRTWLLALAAVSAPARANEDMTITYDVHGRMIATTVSGGSMANPGMTTTTDLDDTDNRQGYVVDDPAALGMGVPAGMALEEPAAAGADTMPDEGVPWAATRGE